MTGYQPIASKNAWDSYFGATSITESFEKAKYTSKGISISSNGNYYAHSCTFNQCSSTSNGGAILSTSSDAKFLIEYSLFDTCTTSNIYGGAIHLTSGTKYITSKVCGYNCMVTNTKVENKGQFYRVETQKSASCSHTIIDSSITNCINPADRAFCIVYHKYGNSTIKGINLTRCEGYQDSAICIEPTISSGVITSILSYSTVANITTNHLVSISVSSTAWHSVISCNIFDTKEPIENSGETFFLMGYITFNGCNIINNIAKYLFCMYYGSTTIKNCTFDDSFSSDKIQGALTLMTIAKEEKFSLKLNHFSTVYCSAQFNPNTNIHRLSYFSNHLISMILHSFHYSFLVCFLLSEKTKELDFDIYMIT